MNDNQIHLLCKYVYRIVFFINFSMFLFFHKYIKNARNLENLAFLFLVIRTAYQTALQR
jgi:hypothetical protein